MNFEEVNDLQVIKQILHEKFNFIVVIIKELKDLGRIIKSGHTTSSREKVVEKEERSGGTSKSLSLKDKKEKNNINQRGR